ncbi:MAG TPA: hypothetical protein VGK10_00685 [Prolixibacteraceae bacterium]|jgi:hypothetical protein
MEKQLIQFKFPGMTERQYDQVWDEMRRMGHNNPAGLLHHVSTFQNNNCMVYDVWESREAFDQFGKILMPILNKIGIPNAQPTITPVHFEYSDVKSHVTH